jgi:hypothetical protein
VKRIRRHDHDPVFPNGISKAYRVLPVAIDAEHLEVRYHRTGWRRLGYEMNGIKRRHTVALIFTDGQHVGSLDAYEFRVAAFTSSNEFLEKMDGHSQATYDIANVICANWEDVSEISDYGDIVELNRVWMSAPFSKRGRFSAAANTLIGHLFKGRSLLILKAFPLEYEGEVTDENAASFLRRQKAMKRHYQRIFDVSAFPGTDGEGGWMYSVPERLRDIISPPSGRV